MKSPLSSLNTPLSPMSTPKIPRHCLPTTLHCKLSLLMKTPSHNPKACHFISKILLPIHPVFMQLPTKNFRSLQKCEMKFLTWILYRKARRGRKRNSWPSQSRKIDRRIQRMQTWWKEQGSQPYQVMYCWCQPTWQRLGIRWRKKGFMAWEERVNLQRKEVEQLCQETGFQGSPTKEKYQVNRSKNCKWAMINTTILTFAIPLFPLLYGPLQVLRQATLFIYSLQRSTFLSMD